MIPGQNATSNAGNTGHAVNAMLKIRGGSVTVGNLLMAQAGSAGRIINSTINLSGGTLSLSSSLVRSGIGVENTSLSLNGGTLDMNGNDIGSLSALIGSGTGSVSLLSGTIHQPGALNRGDPLGDAGSKLGHAVRTVDDQVDLAKTDLDTATALLTARLIAGDAALAAKVIDAGCANWTKHRKRWLGGHRYVDRYSFGARL